MNLYILSRGSLSSIWAVSTVKPRNSIICAGANTDFFWFTRKPRHCRRYTKPSPDSLLFPWTLPGQGCCLCMLSVVPPSPEGELMLVLVKTHGADDKKREIHWSRTSPGVVGFCYGPHIYFLHYYLILSPQYWVGGSLGSRPSPYVRVLIARGRKIEARRRPLLPSSRMVSFSFSTIDYKSLTYGGRFRAYNRFPYQQKQLFQSKR